MTAAEAIGALTLYEQLEIYGGTMGELADALDDLWTRQAAHEGRLEDREIEDHCGGEIWHDGDPAV